MATFRDAKGQDWELQLDALKIAKIRADCDPWFLLGEGTEGRNTFQRLDEDVVLMCRVIYLLTERQRANRGVNEEEFYMGVIGQSVADARNALAETINSFSPPSQRKINEAVAAKEEELRSEAVDKAIAKINDPKLKEMVMAQLDEMLTAEVEKYLTPRKPALSSADS